MCINILMLSLLAHLYEESFVMELVLVCFCFCDSLSNSIKLLLVNMCKTFWN